MSNADSGVVSVRYMIDDVDAAVAFYTKHFGFTVDVDYAPTFASVSRGNLRLLLSGEKTSGRKAMPDGTKPVPGGWNRILLMVSDVETEAKRLRAAGVKFRRDDIVSGPGGSQICNLENTIKRNVRDMCVSFAVQFQRSFLVQSLSTPLRAILK